MNMFGKDKEIILKITNGILLIWFLGALIFTGNNLINLLVKEPNLTYNEYKLKYCSSKYEEEIEEKVCQNLYNSDIISNKSNDFHLKRNLYTAIINVVIVGGALYFINAKKEEENKK